jgi:RHS repeat-associated protein
MLNVGETSTSLVAQKSDLQARLYYYRARYYGPNIGRFLSGKPGDRRDVHPIPLSRSRQTTYISIDDT